MIIEGPRWEEIVLCRRLTGKLGFHLGELQGGEQGSLLSNLQVCKLRHERVVCCVPAVWFGDDPPNFHVPVCPSLRREEVIMSGNPGMG